MKSEAIDDILTNAPKITNSYPHRHSLAQNVVCVLTHDDLRYSVRESDLPRPKQHMLTPLETHTPTPRPGLVLIPPNGKLRARKSGASQRMGVYGVVPGSERTQGGRDKWSFESKEDLTAKIQSKKPA